MARLQWIKGSNRLPLDWDQLLESGDDDHPPEIIVTSSKKPVDVSGGSTETEILEIREQDTKLMMKTDREIIDFISRQKGMDKFSYKLPYKGERLKVTVRRLEAELERRNKAKLTKVQNGNKETIQLSDHSDDGQRVVKNYAAKLRPLRSDMAQDPLKESININMETNPCTNDTSKLRNDTTHKIKLEPLKESINMETNPCTSDTSKLNNDTTHKIKLEPLMERINMEQALIGCQDATREGISLIGVHSNDEKNPVSFDEPSATPNCVTEVNGKRKRNDEQQRMPKMVLHSMIRVHGYKIKKSNAPILEAIFKKHGDIASNCVVKTASFREFILGIICEVVKRIQTNDFATIICDMEEIERQVLDAEATNMNVAWLRTHLEALHNKNTAQKRSTLLGQMKANTSLVKRAAKMDLEERRIELVTAQEQFKKAERCVEVLDLVEMKMNNDFLESEAEKNSCLKDSVL